MISSATAFYSLFLYIFLISSLSLQLFFFSGFFFFLQLAFNSTLSLHHSSLTPLTSSFLLLYSLFLFSFSFSSFFLYFLIYLSFFFTFFSLFISFYICFPIFLLFVLESLFFFLFFSSTSDQLLNEHPHSSIALSLPPSLSFSEAQFGLGVNELLLLWQSHCSCVSVTDWWWRRHHWQEVVGVTGGVDSWLVLHHVALHIPTPGTDGWRNEWMDGWMEEWMDGWMNGCMDRW